MPEISERTSGDDFVDEAIEAAERLGIRGVGFPLRPELQVIVHSLMAEEHVLIAPVRSHQLGLGDHVSDKLLCAAQLGRQVRRVHVEESGVGRNGAQVLFKGLSISIFVHLPLSGGLEAQFPGEHGRCLRRAILGPLRHIGQTNGLNKLGGGLEPQFERDEGF